MWHGKVWYGKDGLTEDFPESRLWLLAHEAVLFGGRPLLFPSYPGFTPLSLRWPLDDPLLSYPSKLTSSFLLQQD